LGADRYDVTVFEKHTQCGGRARTFTTAEGFEFDMGPSWYWMPGIFDHIFAR
jgi:phytoene desaturase